MGDKYVSLRDIKDAIIDLNGKVFLDRRTLKPIIEMLRDLPTIEVSEGEWFFEEHPDGYYHSECSICKH